MSNRYISPLFLLSIWKSINHSNHNKITFLLYFFYQSESQLIIEIITRLHLLSISCNTITEIGKKMISNVLMMFSQLTHVHPQFLVGSVLLIFLVFCVVFLVGSVLLIFLVFCVVFLVGSVLLLFLVFCVVFLVMSTLLISLVFCVVFFVLFVFVLCPVNLMLPVSLDCPFLVTPAAFSTVFWRGWTCCMRLNNPCFTKPYWF